MMRRRGTRSSSLTEIVIRGVADGDTQGSLEIPPNLFTKVTYEWRIL